MFLDLVGHWKLLSVPGPGRISPIWKNLKSNLLHEERHSFFPAKVLFLDKLLRAQQKHLHLLQHQSLFNQQKSWRDIWKVTTILLEGSLFFIEPFWGGRVNIFHSTVTRHLRRASSGFVCINCMACWKKRSGGKGKQKFRKGQVQKAYIYFFHLPISSCFFVTLNIWLPSKKKLTYPSQTGKIGKNHLQNHHLQIGHCHFFWGDMDMSC